MSNEYGELTKPGIYMLLGWYYDPWGGIRYLSHDVVIGFFASIGDAVVRAEEISSFIRERVYGPKPEFVIRDYDTMAEVMRIGEGEDYWVVPDNLRIPDPALARLLEKRALAACTAVGGPVVAKGGRL